MKNYYYLLLVIVITSCKLEDTNVMPVFKYDTTYYSSKKIENIFSSFNNKLNGNSLQFFENGKLKSIKNFVNDTAIGIMYDYYINGNIKRFAYLNKFQIASYALKFDSLGKTISECGSRLVDYSSIFSRDTFTINLYITDFKVSQLKMEISIDSNKYYKENYFNSSECNIKILTFKTVNTTNKKFFVRLSFFDSTIRNNVSYIHVLPINSYNNRFYYPTF